jgi:tRNA-2-methylthio-N6-dimethylallyladenosine synthase
VSEPREADLILVNTCAIREKSEHKVYSLLGRLSGIKQARPEVRLGVGGCVAQQKGEEILRRVPAVDLVFGPDNLFEVPALLAQVEQGQRVAHAQFHGRKTRVENFIPDFGPLPGDEAAPIKAQLAITKGCNNFCTFCVVPHTRGREVSREPDNILAEARRLAEQGVKELTLLGQNVNSYRAGGADFVDLLRRVDAIPGIPRLRYTSPHPKDFDERLAQAHAELPSLCEHLHLPFQAGADRILKAMRRNHTAADYLEKLALARRHVPEIAISTDIIVGFPGETEADFQETLAVMRAARFDHIYAFKFSARHDTPARDYADQVPEAEKADRLARLHDLHESILTEHNRQALGTTMEVLLEGPHPRDRGAMTGRSRTNKPVTVIDCAAPAGALVETEIVATRKFSLVAREPHGRRSVHPDAGVPARS